MTTIIRPTHSPPRTHTFDKKTLAEARKLAGHTRRFAEEAPEWHKALVYNIAKNIRNPPEENV